MMVRRRLSRAVLAERWPGWVVQGLLLAVVGWLAYRGVGNFQANLRALGVSAGFGFLHTQAGFQIAQSLIPFGPGSSYLDAVFAATFNTLLALVVAFGRLAPPGIVRAVCGAYVETFRNVPVLLQILFWYASAIALLPGVADGFRFAGALLNNRGLFLPLGSDRPHVEGFDVTGGIAILPELIALTLGLSIYNSAFLAEIFRAGILSVPRGQIEAATSVGLSGVRAAVLVTLPQALRVALPAAGGQYQILAKSSALAAAVGYPDIMQIVGGTIASQTSQALEAMALVAILYAAINLGIAAIVAFCNRRLLRAEGR